MILNNYWKWLDGVIRVRQFYSGNNSGENLGIIGTSGSAINVFLSFGNSNDSVVYHANYNTLFSPMEVFLSSGDEEITADTYVLQDDITSSFSSLSANMGVDTTGGLKHSIVITGKNNSANELTITRVGLGKNFFSGGINIDSRNMALLAVIELNEPITVGSNNTFTITAEWVET